MKPCPALLQWLLVGLQYILLDALQLIELLAMHACKITTATRHRHFFNRDVMPFKPWF